MSTILEALQMQKSAQSVHFPQQVLLEKGLSKWRVALLAALLVIICLLTVLLYQQFSEQKNDPEIKPLASENKATELAKIAVTLVPEKVQETTDNGGANLTAEKAINSNRESESARESRVEIKQRESKPVNKITFDTQPLPAYQAGDSRTEISEDSPVNKNNGGDGLVYTSASDDLQQRFELALLDSSEQQEFSSPVINNDGSDISDMSSSFQKRVPSIAYDTHVYSTNAGDRWIKINGEKLKEGQFDRQGKIQLLEIQPNRSIFRVGQQSFSLESLTDWKG